MGCWNGTCAVSNLHVCYHQDVAVFMLAKNKNVDEPDFCYNNSLYSLCPLPFYGEYNDYGAVENCHGFGLPILVEAIKNQLFEFEQGENQFHDIEVKRSTFDIEKLFDADQENRLGIIDTTGLFLSRLIKSKLEVKKLNDGLSLEEQANLDQLYVKLSGNKDCFRPITHVIIHGDIFRSIMEKWYIAEYVGENEGNTGYKNCYTHLYFKDIIEDLPACIEKIKNEDSVRPLRFSWNESNRAARWLNSLGDAKVYEFPIIDVEDYVYIYKERKDYDGLEKFLKEILVGLWVNSYMSWTRKLWTRQSGRGSQNQEHLPYQILIEAMADIIKKEKAEYGEEEEEDEGEADDEFVV